MTYWCFSHWVVKYTGKCTQTKITQAPCTLRFSFALGLVLGLVLGLDRGNNPLITPPLARFRPSRPRSRKCTSAQGDGNTRDLVHFELSKCPTVFRHLVYSYTYQCSCGIRQRSKNLLQSLIAPKKLPLQRKGLGLGLGLGLTLFNRMEVTTLSKQYIAINHNTFTASLMPVYE